MTTRNELTVAAGQRPNAVARYFLRFDDGELVRWAFRGLLVGAIGVLALDLGELSRENGWWEDGAATVRQTEPILPAVRTSVPLRSPDPGLFVTADEATLGQPMRFELGAGGVLSAQGSIEPGTAVRFAAELEALIQQLIAEPYKG